MAKYDRNNRQLLLQSRRNTFSVLSGAACSWAHRRRADEDRTCALCLAALTLGSWDDSAWVCPRNPSPRQKPRCNLQARLRWADQVVLGHLAETRQTEDSPVHLGVELC